MNNSNFHYVNIDDTLMKQDSSAENHTEDVLLDPMRQDLDSLGENNEEDANNIITKPQYYRLDRVVFAEPVEETQSTEDSGVQDMGEIVVVDNVMVKRRPGKRNKFFIDIKDGCLDCPLSTCSQKFASKTLLKAHVRKVHCATTDFICEECGAGFTARYLLKRHSVVHSGGKVQCNICGKWLSRRTNLSVHMQSHGTARNHECVACGKRFKRRATLLRHDKFVHRRADGLRDSGQKILVTNPLEKSPPIP